MVLQEHDAHSAHDSSAVISCARAKVDTISSRKVAAVVITDGHMG